MLGRLFIVGALHLDVISETTETTEMLSFRDSQSYADWQTCVGGTAANFARIACSYGIGATLVALTGGDLLGAYLVADIKRELRNIEVRHLQVKNQTTKPVAIMYLNDRGNRRARKVIGPSSTVDDFIDPLHIIDTLHDAQCGDIVLTDGYLFRNRPSVMKPLFVAIEEASASIAIELVPHDIWTNSDKGDIFEILCRANHVSAELATLERLLGLDLAEVDLALRLSRVGRLLSEKCNATVFHLRDGFLGAQWLGLCRPNELAEITEYCVIPNKAHRAVGDAQFIRELFHLTVSNSVA